MLLNEMKMTLEYSCLPMFELICQLSQKESYCETFLSECRNLLENGTDFPVAWSLSVRHADIYNPEERQKLLQLGSFLGTSDVDSQVSIIDMYIQSFDEYRKDAKSKSKKYADTFIYVGVFCALGLFVMLI